MSPVGVVCLAVVAYALAYRFYARWLSHTLFRLNDAHPTPAHTQADGVDYVATPRYVLFGHHFASITGLAPMLGPAVAVIWGWGPAFLWGVLGAIFIGCVHDFCALVLSMRGRGASIGQVAESIVGRRARTLFHGIIFFGITLAMGVFVYVVAHLFAHELAPGHPGYPQAVFPSLSLMFIAMGVGVLVRRRICGLLPLVALAFVLEMLCIGISAFYPQWVVFEAWPTAKQWTWGLLGYAFVASVLPVWALLQPRDFLNALLLYIGLGLAYLGLFVGAPPFAAPMVIWAPEGAPPMLPFVFIVVACGAVSGFHGLVSSGTTAKQLNKETDAKAIGYGGMIGESLLALLATLACTAGFASSELWHAHYGSWTTAGGLATKIGAFIDGTVSFLEFLSIPAEVGRTFMAIVVVSFALTTLDSATRLLRFNLEEMATNAKVPGAKNRYLMSALACGAIGFFAFYEVGGRPMALALWALFGTTNQLLAGLTLSVVALYLRQSRRRSWPIALPAFAMMLNTVGAMSHNLWAFWQAGDKVVLLAVGAILLFLALWLCLELLGACRRYNQRSVLHL